MTTEYLIKETDRIPTQCLLNGDTIKAAEALGHPITGLFAAKLWESLSGYYSPLTPQAAAQLYRDCGYIPFSGYPLARSGKIDRMTRNEVVFELANNPLCQLDNSIN